MIGFLLTLAVVALLLIWVVATYNGLVHRQVLVTESWHQIDVELTRRHDLIPNLVATAQGYAVHEKTVLEQVTLARQSAIDAGHAGPTTRAAAEDGVQRALVDLRAVAEAYPLLRADGVFLRLQAELTDTEDRLAAARRLYNGNVRALNTTLTTVPTNLVARLFPQFRRADFFDTTDQNRAVPVAGF